jgi:hypothetical protein
VRNAELNDEMLKQAPSAAIKLLLLQVIRRKGF